MTSILHLEDSPLDHKLVVARLRADGLTFDARRVETEADYRDALSRFPADLILADYSLPQFDGLTALQLATAACPNVPFIVVSGAMGEQAAVDILRAGATDYVLKEHLDRLFPAVRRAVREAQHRQARHVAEQQVRDARDAAEAANRAKDHFLAVLSHELRTPLTPVLTALQMMESDPQLTALPAEFRDAVQMIRRNVQLEAKLIDDLLDLTRVSRGKLELNVQPTDAHESLRQVLAICDSDLRGKRLTLTTDPQADRPCVRADPARLQQILWNLVKNAVKFTPEGGRVSVTTRNVAGPAGESFEVSVADTGIGIEPAVMSRIFDAFEQGGKQITKQFGGLGLGLAISRALADQHGGSLTAASDGTGTGATFTLRMPTALAAAATPDAPAAGGGDPDVLRGLRVLLVDDHLDTAKAMGRLLKRWGCVVQTADTVGGAVAAAAASRFDVLVSDIGLPDGSGMDLIRQLKSAGGHIHGIAVSGFGMEEDVALSRGAGFAEHLVKPVDLGRLEAAVRKVAAAARAASA